MGWGFLAFCAVVLVVLAPLVVLVLQFSVLGRQRNLTEQLELWLPEARRQFMESRRLLEDLGRCIPANVRCTSGPAAAEPRARSTRGPHR